MPIRVTLLYFGQARDGSGVGEESFDLPKGSLVIDLMKQAFAKHPKLKRMRDSAHTLNEEITTNDASLEEGDLVAFLPPVAGG